MSNKWGNNSVNRKLMADAGLEDEFVWGKIIKIHVIGDISIVEFYWYTPDGGEVKYHSYIDSEDTNRSTDDLDHALLIALGHRYLGFNSQFAEFASKMLGMVSHDN